MDFSAIIPILFIVGLFLFLSLVTHCLFSYKRDRETLEEILKSIEDCEGCEGCNGCDNSEDSKTDDDNNVLGGFEIMCENCGAKNCIFVPHYRDDKKNIDEIDGKLSILEGFELQCQDCENSKMWN